MQNSRPGPKAVFGPPKAVFGPKAVFLLILLCACASTPPQQTSKNPQQEKLEPEPAEEPEPEMGLDQQFAFHMANVIKIIKDNVNDCNAAVGHSFAYIEKNLTAIEEGAAYLKQKEAELEWEEEAAYEKGLEALIRELVPDIDEIMDTFGENCPGDKEKIGRALGMVD